MKVCSLYGAGFYYMPGTDMCIKIGGWVRAEVTYGANGNIAWGPFNQNTNSLATNNFNVRSRGYITADAREQTGYGVARGYIAVGLNSTITDGGTPAGSGVAFSSNRAFVQWAGFTAGLSQSFYDFYPAAALNYRAGFLPQEDTGDGGWWVWGYTAQFGGGLSATLSAEERRNTSIYGQSHTSVTTASAVSTGETLPSGAPVSCLLANANCVAVTVSGVLATLTPNTGYTGWQAPDVVGNLRVDQAWGSAQIMGAAHYLSANYYAPTGGGVGSADETNGHPGTQWGWVVGGGLKINTPFISPGDYFITEANYTEGALRYLDNGQAGSFTNAQGGGQSYGVQTDCVYGGTLAAGNATGCELTTGWSAIAAYEHYWTPQWHQSFTGAYMHVSYDASANNMLCSAEGFGNGVGIGSAAVATPGCNNDWSYWGAGSRLQWDITKSFYVGVEALYTEQISAKSATGLVAPAVGLGDPTLCDLGACNVSNEHNWAFTLRMHKDFLP